MLKRFLRIACLAAAGALVVGSPASGGGTAVNGLIAVERYVDFAPQIWLMRQDGSQGRWFANGATPSWSSDGTRLVYVTPNPSSIVFAGLDGARAALAIANPPSDITSPALSPDGATVAFAAIDGLYVVSSDGGTAARLATGFEPAPAWSPDGAWIAFFDQDSAVALVRPDGSGFHELPGTRAAASHTGSRPAWSPDGTEIAYGDSASGGLYTVRLDGLPPTQLVPYLGNLTLSDPAWSPDGTRIAFFDNADVCIANSDGTDVGRLTYTPVTDTSEPTGYPAWQPLPEGSAPEGSPEAPDGPTGTWNRNQSWYPACGVVWQGLAVTATGPPRVAASYRASLELTVTNRSDTPLGTNGLVGVSASLHGGVLLRVRTSQGRCNGPPPPSKKDFDCNLGALWPHKSAHIKLEVRAGHPGTLVLTCYLPLPANANELPGPDCEQRTKIRPARATTRRADRG
jgi:dipeptidyl aminopeptidase/acylaminoacyl peptidase